MKTKIQIIQHLLDTRNITAEEAMTLMQSEKEYIYYPYYHYVNPFPLRPFNPLPYWGTTCGTSTVNCTSTTTDILLN